MRLFLLIALLSAALGAQTLGQFRIVDFTARTPAVVQTASAGAITTVAAHGLATGAAVYIYAPWSVATDSSNGNWAGNRGRGYYVVSVSDATHFTLTSDMFTGATGSLGATIAAGDKVIPLTTYYLRQGPKLWLDGPVNKGAWSSGTTYKALESVTSGGSTYMAIAASTNQIPPNAAYWKQVTPSLLGPGTFTAGVRDPNGKANDAVNYAFSRAKTLISSYWASKTYLFSDSYIDGLFAAMSAWSWLALNDTAYWTKALPLTTQIEDVAGGTPACKETAGFQYCGRNAGSVDYRRLYTAVWAPGLAVLYETLTAGQKSAVADRLLNDNDLAHNGLEAVGQGCVNDAYRNSGLDTLTWSSNVATITGGGLTALTGLKPGSVILRIFPGTVAQFQVIGRVKTVDSDTQLTFENGNDIAALVGPNATTVTYDGQKWWYTTPFGDGGQKTCGVVWFLKHHPSSPHMLLGQESSYCSNYPNCSIIDDSQRCNRTSVGLIADIYIALLLANDDIRAVRLGEQALNYYMTITMAQEQKSRWSGTNGHGTQYGPDRVEVAAAGIALALKNSLTVTPPGVITGNYLSGILGEYQYATMLGTPLFVQPWTTGYPIGTGGLDSIRLLEILPPMLAVTTLYPNDPLTPASYHYLRTRRGDWGNISLEGGWGAAGTIAWAFPLYDPLATATAPSSLPFQRALVDTDAAECIAAGLYCRPDTGEAVAMSQTGWASTDTQVMVRGGAALPSYNEDNYAEATSFTIVQNNGANTMHLLAGNGLGAAGYGYGKTPSGGAINGNTLSIWNSTSRDLFPNKSAQYQYARMDRWAGDSVTGVADNSYAYARINLTPSVRQASSDYSEGGRVTKSFYLPAAQAQTVTREVTHMKSGSGNPNYILAYDYMKVGTANQLRAYWHLNIGVLIAPYVRHPEYVSWSSANKTATLTYPSSGRLNMKTLPISGSANATVALASEDYAPTSGWNSQNYGAVTAATWAAGTATLTVSTASWGAAIPADGSVYVNVVGANPSALNGTHAVTGYSASLKQVSFALVSDPGTYIGGGTLYYPPWCSYVTPFNPSASCAGNYYFAPGTAAPAAAYPASYRLHTCASTDGTTCDNQTEGEWVTVLQPSTDTAATLPTITQPACSATGGLCGAVEIQDSSYPKVYVFGRKGVTITAASFLTAHGGTAQYVVTGLTNGVYSVTRGGTPVVTDQSVTDGTLSWSSTAGSYGVTMGGALPLVITTTSLPSGTVGIAYSQTLASTGGTAPVTWSVLSGSLPAGTNLTGAVISGTPTTANTYNFTIRATDSGSPVQTNDATYSVTIQAAVGALSITTTSLPSGTVGIAYSQTLAATGGVPPYTWTLDSGTVPTGTNLSTAGVISGTPTTANTYNFTVRVTDSALTYATKALSIVISAPQEQNPVRVSVTSAVTAAIVRYSQVGLARATTCTAEVLTTTVPPLSVWIGSDNGGRSVRVQIATGLTSETDYAVTATCSGVQGESQFTFSSGAPGAQGTLSLSLHPPTGRNISTVTVEHGATDTYGTTESPVACASGCTVTVTTTAGPRYVRWTFKDAGGASVAVGTEIVIAK